MTTEQAMEQVMKLPNPYLSEATGIGYNTVASWKFKFKNNSLSLEKQIEILTRLGYEPQSNLQWKVKKVK